MVIAWRTLLRRLFRISTDFMRLQPASWLNVRLYRNPLGEQLRAQWEYSHAARAFLYVLAMGTLVMSVLDWRSMPDQ